ncbi:MAG: hypothetical protein HZY74_00055 [Brevundimonas sp.]|nr:MAG: hypothetical protein HZY74_00055 [Brevundimonas sp.]
MGVADLAIVGAADVLRPGSRPGAWPPAGPVATAFAGAAPALPLARIWIALGSYTDS